ncbi:hypothetical protein TRFO_43307 [Tritrichomonas foetus]|uniref:Uncharacterized protein n=1 Tax=Tritrichomonas foetus TaxID=1144522 RepID=A0A1J4KRU6_9EUKA|nr:hypothetical protein TRFO_43307 [Tritrichomonas foetus]|eukprot:OHT13616.1 hypothetical protein TRFO_43307 [Tritrichomonas foetus]
MSQITSVIYTFRKFLNIDPTNPNEEIELRQRLQFLAPPIIGFLQSIQCQTNTEAGNPLSAEDTYLFVEALPTLLNHLTTCGSDVNSIVKLQQLHQNAMGEIQNESMRLIEQICDLEFKYNHTIEEYESFQQAVASQNPELFNPNQQILALQEQIAKYEFQIQAGQAQLNQQEQILLALRSENDQIKQQLQQPINNMEKIHELNLEITSLSEQLMNLNNELASVKKDNETLNQALNSIASEKTALESQNQLM